MPKRFTHGSLQAEVKNNGLVKLTITAMKDDKPTSFVDLDGIRSLLWFCEGQILSFDDDQDDVEDLL